MEKENGVSWDKFQLALVLSIALSTLERMVSMAPDRLPPFINLGTGKRIRPIWLIATVIEWLKSKEVVGHDERNLEIPKKNLDNLKLVSDAGETGKRGRGRPRKIDVHRQLRTAQLLTGDRSNMDVEMLQAKACLVSGSREGGAV